MERVYGQRGWREQTTSVLVYELYVVPFLYGTVSRSWATDFGVWQQRASFLFQGAQEYTGLLHESQRENANIFVLSGGHKAL